VIPDSEDHLVKSNQTTSVKTVDENGKEKDSIISFKELKVSEMAAVIDSLNTLQDSIKADAHTNFNLKDTKGKDFIHLGYDSLREARLDTAICTAVRKTQRRAILVL
jgi:vacuolar-type H+-ATPase subunit I/STV1